MPEPKPTAEEARRLTIERAKRDGQAWIEESIPGRPPSDVVQAMADAAIERQVDEIP